VKDVAAEDLIAALAVHFKKSGKIEPPENTDMIKTATHKEMPPQNPDWYYVRAASIARKVYLRGGTGVGGLTKVYGGRRRHGRGNMPNHFNTSARGVLRHVLQQLGEIDIVGKKKDRKGRWITKNGQRELDTIAKQVAAKRVAGAAAPAGDE